MSAAPLLTFYGDDLTGSTDVMEALTSHGLPTVLFLGQPTPAQMRRFGEVRAVGLAGTSRSETPAWMHEHLTPALGWLKDLGASLCHYKVCSTFDSSPDIGSIGAAIDIGAALFDQPMVPLVVGAPQLKRYTAFGNLFAAYQGSIYRIDRHPVMSRHPITPMREADLRAHLALQTKKKVGLVDLAMLAAADCADRVDAVVADGTEIVLFDVVDAESQIAVGRELWRLRGSGGSFVVGSSGVEYALLREWARAGLVAEPACFASPGPVERLAVVSGSCSPTTERQIRHALANGFDGVPLDPRELIANPGAVSAAIHRGLEVLGAGRSVVLYTALGPASDLGAAIETQADARHAIGRALGRILRGLVLDQGLRRGVIAGGDTSSHALRELDIFALTTLLPLPQSPGSPLCTGHSEAPGFDRFEIALKGGQVGHDDYFSRIRDGTP